MDYFDSGFAVRRPSWHRKENLLPDWPGSWDEARKQAGLDWDPVGAQLLDPETNELLDDFQQVKHSGTGARLAVQPMSYAIIDNTAFGDVIEKVVRISDTEPLHYDTVFSIYGGKKVVATVVLDEPIHIAGDPSLTHVYIAFQSRHDGEGGLKAYPTNVRHVCANTTRLGESIADRENVGMTIRHTKNWEVKVEQLRTIITTARRDAEAWAKLAESLMHYSVGTRQTNTFLNRFLPFSDDMTERQRDGVAASRGSIKHLLEYSPTLDRIRNTGYGLTMAATEWSDHIRPHRSFDSYVSRQLLRNEPQKAKAFRIVREMAGIR